MNRQLKWFLYGSISLVVLITIIVPPIQPASYTTQNTEWDGVSTFINRFDNNLRISVTNVPMSLLGDLSDITDIIVIIGGNLPYYPEESRHLVNYVSNGGRAVLFEDKGYGRILTESFGLSLGGILIDQDFHGRNPYHTKTYQDEFHIQNIVMNPRTVIFNHVVRVEQTFVLPNTRYYPLFPLNGSVWEDKNNDGKFYQEGEKCHVTPFVGGILEYPDTGGVFAVIGDSALPTNDMISREENAEWLSEFINFLSRDGKTRVLFDESRKLWIPPTGKGLVSYISVIILGIFHSPLIAFSTMIILGGILAIRKNEEIIAFSQRLKKPFDNTSRTPSQAFLQSAEEEVFSKFGKSSSRSNLYRDLLIEELLEIAEKLTEDEKRYFENSLRQRIFTFADYEKHRYQIRQIKKKINEE